jgi:hypothetical protein
MPFYEKGAVRIQYEEAGSGFPLLIISGGGLNSAISYLAGKAPFNPIEEFKSEYRCIAMDQRNSNIGESSGPLEIDRPWDMYADDQLGLMDHLGIKEFMVMAFASAAPSSGTCSSARRGASSLPCSSTRAAPAGKARPFLRNNTKGWGAELTKRRPEITRETIDKFLTKMYRSNPDFVFTVTRDFVRACQTPFSSCPTTLRRTRTRSRWRP